LSGEADRDRPGRTGTPERWAAAVLGDKYSGCYRDLGSDERLPDLTSGKNKRERNKHWERVAREAGPLVAGGAGRERELAPVPASERCS
jgi:hypothetical protein